MRPMRVHAGAIRAHAAAPCGAHADTLWISNPLSRLAGDDLAVGSLSQSYGFGAEERNQKIKIMRTSPPQAPRGDLAFFFNFLRARDAYGGGGCAYD
jgi:hypothetical protein